jgi:hypothetical protein
VLGINVSTLTAKNTVPHQQSPAPGGNTLRPRVSRPTQCMSSEFPIFQAWRCQAKPEPS